MRLMDFQISRQPGYADRREVNGLTRQVEEEFRYELGASPRVDAPFGKIFIPLYSLREELPEPRVVLLLDVLQVAMSIDFDALRGDDVEARHAILLDTIDDALRLIGREWGWESTVLYDVVSSLRGRERLGSIDLEHLARVDRRTGSRFRVFYQVGEDGWSAVEVVVASSEGAELRRERVAFHRPMRPLELLFPVRSSVIRDGKFVLRDASRTPIATVSASTRADPDWRAGVTR
jgi:hypothetical protein